MDELFYAGGRTSRHPASASTSSIDKTTRVTKSKPVKLVYGVRISTLLFFVAQFMVFAMFVVAWALTTKKVTDMVKGGRQVPGGLAAMVLLHGAFLFSIIGQLIFLERRVYLLRAERYAHKHAGELLPRYNCNSTQTREDDLNVSYYPWNRPSLPTYAAVLSQSGYATGDSDDHLIAIPPPPAYGNTRNSTLLLSGTLSFTPEVQVPPPVLGGQDLPERVTVEGGGLGGNAESNGESQAKPPVSHLERLRRG